MSDSDLGADLDALKTEIDRVRAGADTDTAHLRELLDRVEAKLDEGDDHDDEGFLEHLEETVTRYEVEHPALTNVVSRLIDTLSASGL